MKQIGIIAAVVALGTVATVPGWAQTTVINNNNNITVNTGEQGRGQGGFRINADRGIFVNGRDNALGLEAQIWTDHTQYRPGVGVRIGLASVNLTGKNVTYRLPRGGEFGIAIRSMRTNRIVWSRDRRQNQGGVLQLAPDAAGKWTEFWDQRDYAGNPVPMGAYQIEARVMNTQLTGQIFLIETGSGRPDPDNAGDGRPAPGGIIMPDPASGPRPGGVGIQPPPRPGALSASTLAGNLVLDKTSAKRGDLVRFTYTVVNTGQQAVDLVFPSTALFDVMAKPGGFVPAKRPVWRFSDGMVFAQAIQQLSLAPGERRVFNGVWQIGDSIPVGLLDVNATLMPSGAGMSQVAPGHTRLTIN